MKNILKIIAAILLILLGKFTFSEHLGVHLIADGVIFFVSFIIVEISNEVIKNRKQIFLYIQCKFISPKKEVRLSISYLYRINVDGKYLLVKSRLRDYFQPVGGAYKTLPGSERIFEKLNVRPDRLIETEHGIAKGDLRVYIKRKDVIDFLDWFKTKEDRETSPWREFCEELISTKILPYWEFRFIDYKYKGAVQSPIIKLDNGGGDGMFLFEIYDLVINDEQKTILQKIQLLGDTDKFIWVDDYQIQRLGHDEKSKSFVHNIAPHAKYAQNLKWGN